MKYRYKGERRHLGPEYGGIVLVPGIVDLDPDLVDSLPCSGDFIKLGRPVGSRNKKRKKKPASE